MSSTGKKKKEKKKEKDELIEGEVRETPTNGEEEPETPQ